MSRHKLALIAASIVVLSIAVASQDAVDLAVIDRIKSEAFARSAVMDHLSQLTDVHGPRLTGSPQFEDAAKWAVQRLTEYGVSNARIERWGPFGRSWSIDRHSVELLAPNYVRLAAMPLAWSGSTAGVVTGEPLLAPFELAFARGPKRLRDDFAAYREKWRGKLRGRIVLFTPSQVTPPRERARWRQPEPAAPPRPRAGLPRRSARATRRCPPGEGAPRRPVRPPRDGFPVAPPA